MKRFLCFLAALLLLTGPISAASAAETGLFCAAGGDAAVDLRLDLNVAEAGGGEPADLRLAKAYGAELAALRLAT